MSGADCVFIQWLRWFPVMYVGTHCICGLCPPIRFVHWGSSAFHSLFAVGAPHCMAVLRGRGLDGHYCTDEWWPWQRAGFRHSAGNDAWTSRPWCCWRVADDRTCMNCMRRSQMFWWICGDEIWHPDAWYQCGVYWYWCRIQSRQLVVTAAPPCTHFLLWSSFKQDHINWSDSHLLSLVTKFLDEDTTMLRELCCVHGQHQSIVYQHWQWQNALAYISHGRTTGIVKYGTLVRGVYSRLALYQSSSSSSSKYHGYLACSCFILDIKQHAMISPNIWKWKDRIVKKQLLAQQCARTNTWSGAGFLLSRLVQNMAFPPKDWYASFASQNISRSIHGSEINRLRTPLPLGRGIRCKSSSREEQTSPAYTRPSGTHTHTHTRTHAHTHTHTHHVLLTSKLWYTAFIRIFIHQFCTWFLINHKQISFMAWTNLFRLQQGSISIHTQQLAQSVHTIASNVSDGVWKDVCKSDHQFSNLGWNVNFAAGQGAASESSQFQQGEATAPVGSHTFVTDNPGRTFSQLKPWVRFPNRVTRVLLCNLMQTVSSQVHFDHILPFTPSCDSGVSTYLHHYDGYN